MMQFRLAERLGRTVAELKKTMSAKEFSEWMIYEVVKAGGPSNDVMSLDDPEAASRLIDSQIFGRAY